MASEASKDSLELSHAMKPFIGGVLAHHAGSKLPRESENHNVVGRNAEIGAQLLNSFRSNSLGVGVGWCTKKWLE